jgi:cell division protein FtsL
MSAEVPIGFRPSRARAAAAALLAGASADEDSVAERMRHAARRSRAAGAAPARSAVGQVVHVAAVGALAVAAAVPRTDPAPAPAAEPRRHLRVVPDTKLSPAQRRRRARALLITGIAGAAAIGLALVYFHVVLAQRQFALDRLNSQVLKAQATYQDRRLQVSGLQSPQHIISMAEGQLGMQQPANVTYVDPPAGHSAQGTGTSSLTPSSTAPAGDANWPQIKSALAGIP